MGSERWGRWLDTQRPSLPRACSSCCSSAPWWHFGCLLGTSDRRDRGGCPARDWGQEGQWCPVPCPGVWGCAAGAGLAARAGSSCSRPLCELSSSSLIFCCSGNTPKLYYTSCRWLKGELKLQEEMWSIQKGRFSSFSLHSLQLNYFRLINVSFYPKQKAVSTCTARSEPDQLPSALPTWWPLPFVRWHTDGRAQSKWERAKGLMCTSSSVFGMFLG